MTARWVRIALEWCAPVWLVWIAALVWVSCSAVESIEPSGDTSTCEHASWSGICCGVYGFAQGSSNELGHVELCVLDEDLDAAQSLHGVARPSWSVRFHGYPHPVGFWLCATETYTPKKDERGCDAHDGCFCP